MNDNSASGYIMSLLTITFAGIGHYSLSEFMGILANFTAVIVGICAILNFLKKWKKDETVDAEKTIDSLFRKKND